MIESPPCSSDEEEAAAEDRLPRVTPYPPPRRDVTDPGKALSALQAPSVGRWLISQNLHT